MLFLFVIIIIIIRSGRVGQTKTNKKKGARGYGIASHSVCVCYVCWCITLKCDRWPSSLEGAPAAHAPLLSGAQRDSGKYRNERGERRGSRGGGNDVARTKGKRKWEEDETGGERGGETGKGAIVIIFWGASLSFFSFFFFEQGENKGGRIIDKR